MATPLRCGIPEFALSVLGVGRGSEHGTELLQRGFLCFQIGRYTGAETAPQ